VRSRGTLGVDFVTPGFGRECRGGSLSTEREAARLSGDKERNMIKSLARGMAACLALSLAACSTPPTKQDVGTVVGGGLGGILGAQVGGGAGKTAAIIGGTVLGALLGGSVGHSMDQVDELKAQQALENNRTGQASSWVNPDTGNQVTVVPTETYQKPSGQYCREFTTDVVVGGKKEAAYGTACRQPDGSWKIVSQH
jgi:surface antigen